uniref:SPRY domain-containing protein 7 n=1 Tax=Moina brachiata TaxID=675436 RepID=A0A4Y7NJF3_9CRUS|nr:EOG090X0EPP [Moina brachiata]SVE93292.1 EOG090X0EPP [Moina brachiata]
MASIFCCFRGCANFLDLGIATTPVPIKKQPLIVLDSQHIGQEVVLIKNGSRICGTGGALANTPINQDKAYFEVRLQQTGIWGLGLATGKADLNKVPLGNDPDSWVLCSDGYLRHNKEELHHITQIPQEGDTIGISYNHIELNFYVNGQKLDCPFTNVKGEVYPAVYVDEGAVLDVVFEDFARDPPPGYDKIILECSNL